MLRRGLSTQSGMRFFSSRKSLTTVLLPTIKAGFQAAKSQTSHRQFFHDLDYQFLNNPFVTPLLAHIEILLTTGQCKLDISPSFATDLLRSQKSDAICYYDHQRRTIVTPSSPSSFRKIYQLSPADLKQSVYRNDNEMYLGMFLHEANHAHDFILSRFGLNKQDAITLLSNKRTIEFLPNLDMAKMDMALGINYTNNVMNEFSIAVRNDLIELDEIAGNTNHPKHTKVIKFYDQLHKSLHHYSVTVLLAEFKSRFIEFSITHGQTFLRDMFPATSSWYLYQHLPNAEFQVLPLKKMRV